jgi:hypothetical protein|tara:strand:- start:2129 stop:2317 length:189 start_codon:yes stop_codon:yes gene_type:complete
MSRKIDITNVPKDFWKDLPENMMIVPVTGDWSHIPEEKIFKGDYKMNKPKKCPGCPECEGKL